MGLCTKVLCCQHVVLEDEIFIKPVSCVREKGTRKDLKDE